MGRGYPSFSLFRRVDETASVSQTHASTHSKGCASTFSPPAYVLLLLPPVDASQEIPFLRQTNNRWAPLGHMWDMNMDKDGIWHAPSCFPWTPPLLPLSLGDFRRILSLVVARRLYEVQSEHEIRVEEGKRKRHRHTDTDVQLPDRDETD